MNLLNLILQSEAPPAVVPILVGPLQTLIALLPGLLLMLGGLVLALFKPSTAVKIMRLLWQQKFPAAGMAGIAAGCWFGLPQLFPSRQGTAETVQADWLAHRGGKERRGWQAGNADPCGGERLWAYAPKDGKSVFASPAVCGKYVYSSTVEFGPLSDRGKIVCLDAETGEEVWRDNLGLRSVFSSPAISGDYLVCGEGLHFIKDAQVVCLDRRTGRTCWTFRTHEHVESSPCISDGVVFIGAGSDGYYALKLEGDGDGNPIVLWHKTEAEGFIDCETSPIIHEGKVYVGLGNGGEALCCLDARSGEELWRLKAKAPVFTPPSIADGCVIFGMGYGDFVKTAEELGKPTEGWLWCVDLQTKQTRWSFQMGRTMLAAPVISAGRVYAASLDGTLYCLSVSDGKLLAKWNAQAPISTSPCVTDSGVFLVTKFGILYALEAESLAPLWETILWTTPPSAQDNFFSSPTVANGHVYVGSAQEGLLCLGRPGKPPEATWPGYLGGPERGGRCDQAPMAKAYETAWIFPSDENQMALQITAPPAYFEGNFFLPIKYPSGAGLLQLKIDPQDAGKPCGTGWSLPCTHAVVTSPVVRRGIVYLVEGQPGDSGRRLRAVDANTGKECWSAAVETGVHGDCVLAGNKLFTTSLARGLQAFGLDGAEAGRCLWSNTAGPVVGIPWAEQGRVIVTLKDPPRLSVLDLESGRTLWTRELDAEPTSGPVLLGEQIGIGTAAGIKACALLDGAPLWSQAEAGMISAPLSANSGLIAGVNSEGRLNLLSAQDGKILKSIGGVPAQLGPQLSKEGLFYFGAQGFLSTTLDSNALREIRFKLPAKLGKPVTPALTLESHLLIATTRGLVCAKPKERKEP